MLKFKLTLMIKRKFYLEIETEQSSENIWNIKEQREEGRLFLQLIFSNYLRNLSSHFECWSTYKWNHKFGEGEVGKKGMVWIDYSLNGLKSFSTSDISFIFECQYLSRASLSQYRKNILLKCQIRPEE